MPRSIAKAGSLAVTTSVGLSLVAGAIGIVLSVQAKDASATALNTLLPAASSVNRMLAEMVDQETGERGYVLTAQTSFLQPYDSGRSAIDPLVDELHRDLRGDPGAEDSLDLAVRRYESWLHTFAMPQVADVRAGDFAAAVAAEASGRGKALFGDLRHSMATLGGQIAVREESATSRVRSLDEDLIWLLVATCASAVIGAVLGLGVVRRWIIRPIQVLERDIGSVAADDGTVGAIRVGGPEEVRYLGRNVEFMRQRLRRQRRELGNQQRTVQILQNALLPRQLPQFSHFEVDSRYVPAATEAEVGGDWFNVREVDSQHLFVAVGDVAGNGLAAASLMASLHFALDAYAAENPQPAVVLRRLSRLVDPSKDDRFATVVCCLVDVRARVVHVASAGHLCPIIATPDLAWTVSVKPGPPIGLAAHDYVSTTVPLPPESTILLFSDGLVERRGESIDVSVDRVAGLAIGHMPLGELLDLLVASSGPGQDDTVVCGVRLREPSSGPPASTREGVVMAAELSAERIGT